MKSLYYLPLLAASTLFVSCKSEKSTVIKTKTDYLVPHNHTPHEGVMSLVKSETQSKSIELKLHDDKGDLELWITNDSAGKVPYNLPLDTIITVKFPELDKKITLSIRDNELNKDEDGNTTITEEKTNYFIFPGETGQDPEFLKGEHFISNVILSYTDKNDVFTSQEFKLYPHTH